MEVKELKSNSNTKAITKVNVKSNQGKETITTDEIMGNNSNPTKKEALMVNVGSNDSRFYTEVNGIDHVINMTSSPRDTTDKVTGKLITSRELNTSHTLNAIPKEVDFEGFEGKSTIQGNNLATHTQASHIFTNGIKEKLLHPTAEIEE